MLTAKQLRAVELLLEGKMSLKQIASQVGVSESTLSRWKKDEAFSAFYAQGLRRVLNDAAAEALRTEMQILLHSDSDSSRLSAAKDLLDRAGFKTRDAADKNADNRLQITVCYGDAKHSDRKQ